MGYVNQHPEVTNTALGVKYGVSRETIRLILDRGRRQTERNRRLANRAATAAPYVAKLTGSACRHQ
jgi:hypothetical protein